MRTEPWITGFVDTPIGPVPQVGAALTRADRMGATARRLHIARMTYAVPPGLYALGEPGPDDPVLVSANYKMSFDRLRSAMAGYHGWILVLDTKGINVWCAAGKGTFGTEELVERIRASRLSDIVSHRRLIVPQLGATGVAAHEVKKRSGFRVVFGPVRAADLPAFIGQGMKAPPEMRRVTFTLRERIVLIPVELVEGGRYILGAAFLLMLLSGLGRHGYALHSVLTTGLLSALLCGAAFVGGAVITPALLPFIPGRAFSLKGGLVGLALVAVLPALRHGHPGLAGASPLEGLAWLFLIPAMSSFFAMNFTGASTFTSLSGVKKEMRLAVPAQIALAGAGLALWIAGRFI